MMTDLKVALKKYFGFDHFRPGQEAILQYLLNGQNTLAVLPTGGGKTLLYQLYGALTHQRVVIVSPLISLMQDQVSRLQYLGSKRVVALTSALDFHEKAVIIDHLNQYQFIYVSPEMLANPDILNRMARLNIGLLVIDEAHCISEWGPDFRPDYLKLGQVRQKLGQPLTLMMTATATPFVRKDILNHLNFQTAKPKQVLLPINRKNIFLSAQICQDQKQKDQTLLELVQTLNGAGIIYFSSKKQAEQVADLLNQKTDRKVMAYHGGMDHQRRFHIQQQFMDGNLDIVCATSAFGMGIDKDDVRFVIHYHLPANIQSYVQEIGRCGRDQKPSLAILLYEPNDRYLQLNLIDHTIPDIGVVDYLYQHPKVLNDDDQFRVIKYYFDKGLSFESVQRVFDQAKRRRLAELSAMVNYVYHPGCRRTQLLDYFDEDVSDNDRTFCCDHDSDFWGDWRNFNQKYLKVSSTTGPIQLKDWRQVIDQLFLLKN